MPPAPPTAAQPATHVMHAAGFRVSGCVDLLIQPESAPRIFVPTAAGSPIPDVRIVNPTAPPAIPRQSSFQVIAQANGCTASTLQAWLVATDQDSTHDVQATSVVAATAPRQFTITFNTTGLTSGMHYALLIAIVPSGTTPVACDGWSPCSAA